jgi:K+-sensing histidine kinase KdpD
MSNNDNQLEFSTVLAAAVHDMKNSLCLLLQSIENLNACLPSTKDESSVHLASAHYEASRLNTGLVQLLSLYRAGLKNLPINIDQHYLDDVIDEVLATNASYLKHKNISLKVELVDNLSWYLDLDLICILLNDMLINAMRYCQGNILLTVSTQEKQLLISVHDDGPGYPAAMLEANKSELPDFDISHGRTGLGLFFARLIAKAHSKDEQYGLISLQNGGKLGGSVFTLMLP